MPGKGKPFKKGEAKGRPKGVPNKLTKSVRETVLIVFNELQGKPGVCLADWAEKKPTEFYNIAAKLIPTELSGRIDANINLNIVRRKPNT